MHIVLLLLSAVSYVAAYDMVANADARDSILYKRLAREGLIHIDGRAPPPLPAQGLAARRYTDDDASETTSASAAQSTRSASGSATLASITTSASSISNSTASGSGASKTISSTSSTESVPTSLPTPFDTSLGINFTVQACPTFFNSFINNATFKSCLPVSLLLQNSMGFFRATRNAKFLDTVLDASCSASLAICSPLMSSIANQLISDAYCGQDYKRQNPIVMQAYTGLLAYEPLYNATCLENPATGNYCFTDAVTNTTNSGDMYPYYTALGIPLPQAAQPTCSNCLQQTMNIFAGYARRKDQPLSRTYVPCAIQIDGVCGPSFAKADVKVAIDASKNAGSRSKMSISIVAAMTTLLIWTVMV